MVTEIPPVEHPVVGIHPRTGRKGLFVIPGFTSQVVGVSDAESRGILDLLYAHLTKPEHTIRHCWATRRRRHLGQPRHRALREQRLHTQTRVMARVTIRGDRPHGPSTTPPTG